MNRRQQSPMGLVIAAALALVGLVWAAQGLGAPIGRSFMIGDLRWTAAGTLLIVLAAVLTWRRLRRSH